MHTVSKIWEDLLHLFHLPLTPANSDVNFEQQQLTALVSRHGGLCHVPTRQLSQLNRLGRRAVKRQRLGLAMANLNDLVTGQGLPELTATASLVMRYLNNDPLSLSMREKFAAIARAPSVFLALVELAVEYDSLSMTDWLSRLSYTGQMDRYYTAILNQTYHVY